MVSRFKASLGVLKDMRDEAVYHTKNEDVFVKQYVEENHLIKLFEEQEDFSVRKTISLELKTKGLYRDLYSAFVFAFEIEKVLAEIEGNGISLARAESLMNLCGALCSIDTYAMICLDDAFSLDKKYSLAQDINILATNIYNSVLFFHSIANEKTNPNDVITATKYDEIDNRLSCKYIRSGIAVLKLFNVLALLQISPVYSEDVHYITKELIQSLREILFNKRVIKLVVDYDTHGLNCKPHKTTRLKIYFAMGNSDRYCIRLDFPHDGEDSIHLNMNEPGHSRSSGLPFDNRDYKRIIEICEDPWTFDKLFYQRDDLYWFKSNFASTVKEIRKSKKDQGQALNDLLHERSHIKIASSENMSAVTEFSEALAEAMIDYGIESIYGYTDDEDSGFYKYVLFQDLIFETVIGLRAGDLRGQLNSILNNKAISKEMERTEAEMKSMLCKYIADKFPDDEELKKAAEMDAYFLDFLSHCLDRMDDIGL